MRGNEQTSLYEAQAGITAVVPTPDGQWILLGDFDGHVKLWDRNTKQCVSTLVGHTGPITGLMMHPDGQRFLSASWDMTVNVWDLQCKEVLQTLSGHRGWINAITTTPNGFLAFSVSSDRTLKIWDLEDGTLQQTLIGHQAPIVAVAVHPTEMILISASSDRTLKIWDLTTWKARFTLEGHHDQVASVAVMADGSGALSGSYDGTLKRWDLMKGCECLTFAGHHAPVTSVALTPDGYWAASASYDGTVKIWQAVTGAEICTLSGHTERIWAVAITADGRYVISASTDHSLILWDVAQQQARAQFWGECTFSACAITPDGKQIVVASRFGYLQVLRPPVDSVYVTMPLIEGDPLPIGNMLQPDPQQVDGKAMSAAMQEAYEELQQILQSNQVVLFMRGTSEIPLSAFSSCAVDILRKCGVSFTEMNVLAHPKLAQVLTTSFCWSTFPQLYVAGKFLGGSDLLPELYRSGELQRILAEVTPSDSMRGK